MYEKTIAPSERFVLFISDAQHKKDFDTLVYGLWLTECELIAVFQVNHMEANWWINVAVDGWGRRWLPNW